MSSGETSAPPAILNPTASLFGTELVAGWKIVDIAARDTIIDFTLQRANGHEALVSIGGPLGPLDKPTPLGALEVLSRKGMSRTGQGELRLTIAGRMKQLAPRLIDVFPHLALAGPDPVQARTLITEAWQRRRPGTPLPKQRWDLILDPDEVHRFFAPELTGESPPLVGDYRLTNVTHPLTDLLAQEGDSRWLVLEFTPSDGPKVDCLLGISGEVPREVLRSGGVGAGIHRVDEADRPPDALRLSLLGWLLALVSLKSRPDLRVRPPDDDARDLPRPSPASAPAPTAGAVELPYAALIGLELAPGRPVTDVAVRGAQVDLSLRDESGAEVVLQLGGPLASQEPRTALGGLRVLARNGSSHADLSGLPAVVFSRVEQFAPQLIEVFPHLALLGPDSLRTRALLEAAWKRHRPEARTDATVSELLLDPSAVESLLAPDLALGAEPLVDGYQLSRIMFSLADRSDLAIDLRCLVLEFTRGESSSFEIALGLPEAVPNELGRIGPLAVGVSSLSLGDSVSEAERLRLLGGVLTLIALKTKPDLQLRTHASVGSVPRLSVQSSGGVAEPAQPRSRFTEALRHLELLPEWKVSGASVRGTVVELIVQRDSGHELLVQLGTPAGTPTVLGGLNLLPRRGLYRIDLEESRNGLLSRLDEIAPALLDVFPHLAFLGPDPTRARELLAAAWQRRAPALPAPEPRSEMALDPEGLTTFLTPELSFDQSAFAAGYHLSRVRYELADQLAREINLSVLTVEFSRSGSPDQVLTLGPVGAVTREVVRSDTMAVGRRALELTDPASEADRLALAGWLLTLVTLKSSPELSVKVPNSIMQVRSLALPKTDASSVWVQSRRDDQVRVAMIGSEADCQQGCSFCALRSYASISDGGKKELEAKRMQLRLAREEGISRVQLEGVDPMAFSELLTLVRDIRDLGFTSLTITGTGRRFANPEFRRAFLECRPPDTRVYVPLYGMSAAVHDAVVGRPGAHAEVMAAIEGLLADGGPSVLALTTVITAANVGDIAGIRALAGTRGVSMYAQLPYPSSFRELDGPYRKSAVSERVILDTFATQIDSIPEVQRPSAFEMLGRAVRHPCVLFAAEQRTRLPFFAFGLQHKGDQLAAVDGQGIVRTKVGQLTPVPIEIQRCPHAGQCAAAANCPAEIYGAYAARFGLDEFAPVPATAMPAAKSA